MERNKHRIALIYEGISVEDKLLKNMAENFFLKNVEIEFFSFPAEGNIYMLWSKLKEDDYETNVIDVIKEMSKETKKRLDDADLHASSFSEIYLFFDYDGHNNNIPQEYLGQDVLGELLRCFNNETEMGKLYISYPMVEAIKEISFKQAEYNRLYVPLEEIHAYKHSFERRMDYGKYDKYDVKMWEAACRASVRQAGLIVQYNASCTYEQFIHNFGQEAIYKAQKEHYIRANHMLAILNSIPLFLMEYLDEAICGGYIEPNKK